MSKISLLCLLLAVFGCRGKQEPTADQAKHESTNSVPLIIEADSAPVAALRQIAHEHGLRWSIRCVDDDRFFAAAFDKRQPEPHVMYIEEGGLPWYSNFGATQDEAALVLYRRIKNGLAWQAEHRPEEHHEHKKMCPPELSGD